MRKLCTFIAVLALAATMTMAQSAQAQNKTPRQLVIVVSEGLGAQVVDFGVGYVKTAYEEGATVAFDEIKAKAKVQPAGANAVTSLRGILKTAAANGYKTGLITTADVTFVASLFYDLPEAKPTETASTLVKNTKFDFIAGGGRAHFAPLAKAFTQAGGGALFDVEALDADITDKALALQSDADLTYILDRDLEKEAGFAELVTLALQTLSADDAPFVLVVHDTLIKKALEARDTPALVEQFRELDGILADVLGFGEENPGELGLALLSTAGTMMPRFTTTVPTEQVNSFYILSELPMSYGKAGQILKGANDAKLTAFATEEYKGWKLAPETRAAILAGTMTPEAAVRASYEPALKIEYTNAEQQPTAYVWGFEAAGDVTQTLKNIVSGKPAPKTPQAEEGAAANPAG